MFAKALPRTIVTAMKQKKKPVNHKIDDSMSHALKKRFTSYALRAMRSAAMKIKNAEVDKEDVWFRNILLGILNSAQQDLKYVQLGVKQNSPYLAAWGCRNLLELRVITTYVVASLENATEFKNDFVIDSKEFFEALSNYARPYKEQVLREVSDAAREAEETGNPAEAIFRFVLDLGANSGEPRNPAVDRGIAEFKQFIIDFGIKETRPKTAGAIAGLIGHKDRFNPIFKLCSKIMHRTTISIASTAGTSGLDHMLPFLSESADREIFYILKLLNQHCEKHGVSPPQP